MTHETKVTVFTRFHAGNDNVWTVDLTPAETRYLINYIEDTDQFFAYLHSINRWVEIPDSKDTMIAHIPPPTKPDYIEDNPGVI